MDAVVAVVDGDAAALRALLARDPSLVTARATAPHRSTLLHYVAANGVEDELQRTPPNATEIARILLAAGAEPDALSEAYGGGRNATPLCMLVSSWHPFKRGVHAKLVDVFVAGGARVDGLDDDGAPLGTALCFGYTGAAMALAACGARVDNLPFAAGVGALEATRAFVRALAAGDVATALGSYTPVFPVDPPATPDELIQEAFHFAITHGNGAVARCLLEAGADPNGRVRGHHAELPLMQALFLNRPGVACFLLDHGADPSLRDGKRNTTPADYAREQHPDLADEMRERRPSRFRRRPRRPRPAAPRGRGGSMIGTVRGLAENEGFVAIARSLRTAEPADVGSIVRRARDEGSYLEFVGPRRLARVMAIVGAARMYVDDPTYFLCSLIQHGNGYFREAALATIARCEDAVVTAAVMVGADDHVPEVRRRAWRLLEDCPTEYLAQCAVVLAAPAPDDGDRSMWRPRAIERLGDEQAVSALRQLARSGSGVTPLASLRLLLDHFGRTSEIEALVDAAEWRVRRAIAQPARITGRVDLLERLCRDDRTPVRHAAVWQAMHLDGAERDRVMRIAIDDRARRIRRWAGLSLRDDAAVVERVRAAVDEGPIQARVRALETFAFLAPAEAPAVARRALLDPAPPIRRTAFRALADVRALGAADLASIESESDGPTLVRAVRLALGASTIPRPSLLALFDAPVLPNAPGAATLLREFSLFDRHPHVARAVAEGWPGADKALESLFTAEHQQGVCGWVKPDAAQRARIRDAIDAYGSLVPGRLLEAMQRASDS